MDVWKIITAAFFIISLASLALVDTLQREAAFLCGKYCEESAGSNISAPGGFAYSVGECACKPALSARDFFPEDFLNNLGQ